MKKNILFALAVLLLLSSCATTVSLNTLKPSEVNLGANQVIAVAPTETKVSIRVSRGIPVYAEKGVPVPSQLLHLDSFASNTTPSETAKNASRLISKALSEGIYTVFDSQKTQNILKTSSSILNNANKVLKNNGVTLLMESSIDAMSYDEFITGRAVVNRSGETYYNYYLVQKASLSLSYKVTDVKSGRTVDAGVFSGNYPKYTFEEETLIATVDPKGTFTSTGKGENASDIFSNIVSSFKTSIRNRLVPHVETLNFSLMTVKNNKEFDEINKLVSEGYLSVAYDKYYDIYKKTKMVEAGYNSAVLLFAMGNQEDAINFAQNLYRNTLNADVAKLASRMKSVYEEQKLAMSQAGLR